jgi:hypothetical protein
MEREHQESMELQRRQMLSDEAEMIAIQQSRSAAMARNTAVQQSAPQIAQSVPEVNISDRLEDIARLASLRDSGVLTEEEFESEKAAIIRLIQ